LTTSLQVDHAYIETVGVDCAFVIEKLGIVCAAAHHTPPAHAGRRGTRAAHRLLSLLHEEKGIDAESNRLGHDLANL
jgi:hypothetical protein